ncbi:MFS transporter [Gibbsiella dentisursi]|uniref:MFS transporter n=1 Tax=Gibbsiella dentisursi TaxID=796890 RepID=A0ABP7LR27_9GAMM
MIAQENNRVQTAENGPDVAHRGNHFGVHGWRVIVFQGVLFWIAAGAVTHGLNVMLPALARNFGLDYSVLLALATPASWSSILAGPLCAWLSEKKGAKFNVIFCLIACGLCYGLLGYCGSFIGFTLLFAGVCFFGTGFAYVGGTAIMANWFVRRQGLALGWCTIGQTLSSAFFVPTLAGLFLWLGVRDGFWGISAMMFIVAVLAQRFIANRPEDMGLAPDNGGLSGGEQTERRRQHDGDRFPLGIGQLLRMRDVWFMGIATGGLYIMLVGVTSQIVPRLVGMGYAQSTAIFYMTLSALCGLPAAYGWGWCNQRFGVRRSLLFYTLWWMLAIVINMLAHHAVALWISLVMIGLAMPGATNLSTALIAAKFPRRIYVRALGIIHPIQSVVRCSAFTLLAFGLTYLGGYAGAYLLLAGVGAITLLLFWLIDVTPVSTGMTADDAR